jgi:hypothetical protein
MQSVDPPERTWQAQSTSRICWWLVGLATAMLAIGLLFYLTFRPALPVALQKLHVSPLPFARPIGPSLFAGSFPSLVHVAAFTLLTCAVLGASLTTALAAGAFWAAIDIFWEFACGHPFVLAGYRLLRIGAAPACTYDVWDIVASLLGAAAAAGIVWLILKLHSSPPAPAKE